MTSGVALIIPVTSDANIILAAPLVEERKYESH